MLKKRIKNSLLHFLAISLVVLLFSCKKKTAETLLPYAKVTFTLSSNNVALDSGEVDYYVFDTEQAFQTATQATTPSGYVLSGTVTDEKIVLSQLPSGVDHFVLVRYYDTKTFPGFSLLYTNEESTYRIPALGDQTEAVGELSLKPQEGLLTFYSKEGNSGILPIQITIGSDQTASVSAVNTTALASPQTIKFRKGNYTAKGKSTSVTVCEWIKNVDVLPGQNTMVELEECEYGHVSFYSESGNLFPIVVTLGIGDTLGNLQQATIPSSCEDPAGSPTLLMPGKYSYYAYSEKSACAWSDTFTVAKGDCKLIGLEFCQK